MRRVAQVIASRSVNASRSVAAQPCRWRTRTVLIEAGGLQCAGWRRVIAARSVNASRSGAARSSLQPKPEGAASDGWPSVRRVAQGDRFAIDARCACGARANGAVTTPQGAGPRVRLRQCAGWRRVITDAIGQRFALVWSANVAANNRPGDRRRVRVGVCAGQRGDRYAIEGLAPAGPGSAGGGGL